MREWRCSFNQGRLALLVFSQISIAVYTGCSSLEWGQREGGQGVGCTLTSLPLATTTPHLTRGIRDTIYVTQQQPTLCNIYHTLCNTHLTLCNIAYKQGHKPCLLHKTLTHTIQGRRVVCRQLANKKQLSQLSASTAWAMQCLSTCRHRPLQWALCTCCVSR